ncbi:MAG: hypothetical protein PHN92_03425 [Geobacter sp.]|nr:hypothetical protein [Geobacter sp.]
MKHIISLALVVVVLMVTTTSYARTAKEVKKEMNDAVSSVLKVYKREGMSGLINFTSQCYKETKNNEFVCVYIDLASRYLDQMMADQSKFPPTEFFGDESFGPRIFGVFSNKNMDEAKSNEYLRAATPTINKLVDTKLRSKK